MSLTVNKELTLWAIALIQPCSAKDIHTLLNVLYPDSGPIPTLAEVNVGIEYLTRFGWVALVHVKSGLYSITEGGHEKLSKKQRHLRDKMRLFLLKAASSASFTKSEGVAQELLGDPPSEDVSSSIKEVARPVGSAAIPHNRQGSLARYSSRTYWPRLLEQLDSPVGLTATSSDTFLSYYSFHTVAAINGALKGRGFERDLTQTGIALAIGISPKLLGYLAHKPEANYRKFEIGKRGGGTRTIHAPRVFLKTVQSWIKDYILWRLPVHESCHSYVKRKSIVTNSLSHVDKPFVANIDIEDFFGSISAQQLESSLISHGIGQNLATVVARLSTLQNALPQGAPTSPLLSNFYLFEFDEAMTNACETEELKYSRYADDITVSGESREKIVAILNLAKKLLQDYGLRLNDKKTRIASRGGQQRVAGVVVNSVAQPPRKFRRRIRAKFHEAEMRPELFKGQVNVLRGYLSYLNSFPHLQQGADLEKYRKVIRDILRE